MPRVAVTMAVTIAVAVASAVPLRGVTDVRPEISRVIEVEASTVGVYQTAVTQFKLGTVNAEALAQVIERKITPELQAMQARFKALGRVPPEHQPLVANARRVPPAARRELAFARRGPAQVQHAGAAEGRNRRARIAPGFRTPQAG